MPLRRLTMVAAFAAALVAPLLGATAQAAPAAGQEGLQLIATHDSLLATHYWYVQTFAGHKVLGSYYAKHVDKAPGQRPGGHRGTAARAVRRGIRRR
jgi:hypothetical protein